MAIYHFQANAISRQPKGKAGNGCERSAVACAAYRSGSALYDERHRCTHNYTNKSDVVASEIMAPDHTPTWLLQREALWNAVEKTERRKDASLARELEVSLPRELNHQQRTALMQDFVHAELTSRGIIADVAYHAPVSKRDQQANPHAHILYTTRTITPDGLGKKNLALESNRVALFTHWREAWEKTVNKHLALAGSTAKVDRRSLAEQGKEWKQPEPKVGAQAWAMEHRGIETDRVAHWREVQRQNRLLLDATPSDLNDIIALVALNEARDLEHHQGHKA